MSTQEFWADEKLNLIKTLIIHGCRTKEIAEFLGITATRLYKILQDRNISIEELRPTPYKVLERLGRSRSVVQEVEANEWQKPTLKASKMPLGQESIDRVSTT